MYVCYNTTNIAGRRIVHLLPGEQTKLIISDTGAESIDEDSFAGCEKIQDVEICNDSIVRLPLSLSKLRYLTCLSVYNVLLSINNWNEFTTLRKLYVGGPGITELHSSICALTGLTDLSVSRDTCGLPDDIDNMISLKRLALYNGSITRLPVKLSRLTSLTELDISMCHDISNIDTACPQSIRVLRIDELKSSFPPGLTCIQALSWESRKYSIPALSTLTGLTDLVLFHSGAEVLNFTELPELQKIAIYGNCLTAQSVLSIFQLTSLKKVYLHESTQLDHIPDSIRYMRDLETLTLHGGLIRTIPPLFGTTLQFFNLHQAQFTTAHVSTLHLLKHLNPQPFADYESRRDRWTKLVADGTVRMIDQGLRGEDCFLGLLCNDIISKINEYIGMIDTR